MDAFVPLLTGAGSVSIVQVKQAATYHVTLDAPPAQGNKLFVLTNAQENQSTIPLDIGGLTTIGATMKARSSPAAGTARLGYRDVLAGDPAGPYGSALVGSNTQTTIIEVAGLPVGGPLNDVGADDQTDTSVEISITPDGGVDAWLVGAFGSFLYMPFGGTPTFTPNGDTTAVGTLGHNAGMWGVGQLFYGESDGSAVVLGGTQGGTTAGGTYRYGIRVAAFASDGGSLSWPAAPDTVDGADATADDVTEESLGAAGDVFWRVDLGSAQSIGELVAVLGIENAGDVEIILQGGDASDWSDAATVESFTFDATGALAADDVGLVWDAGTPHRYWQLVIGTPQDVRVFEVGLAEVAEHVPTEPGRAILEIYVHDEDASRWGTATWATGPATGTEGIWSGAGWQDVTPQGVTAHIIWGSREPDKGILARQNAASWNVETYDPDRILDPDNAASPHYPQIVAGTPIRISHDTTIIRTGLIDRIGYKYKAPDYRGQLLCTDTISLLNQAKVPEDSILGDTLITRVQDAIEAAGVAVGGIPLPPSGAGFTYPAIAPLDTDNPRERSVWDHITAACEEVLFVPFIGNTAGLGLRNWGFPLDRGREITAANLEDLESVSHEDGLYSVVRVQGSDPDIAPIEREAAPLPRYGRRVYERTELTVDPEGFADAVLQERSWPGVRYSPGTIHCWTAEEVDYFGSLQIMERVTVTHPGVVSVQGRILGGELWVQHYRDNERGATWQFTFAVATEGSTAIGLTTLVSSQAGDTLLDSQTEADYLEAD